MEAVPLVAAGVVGVGTVLATYDYNTEYNPVKTTISNRPPIYGGYAEPGFDTLDPMAMGYTPKAEEFVGTCSGQFGLPRRVTKTKSCWQFKYDYGTGSVTL